MADSELISGPPEMSAEVLTEASSDSSPRAGEQMKHANVMSAKKTDKT